MLRAFVHPCCTQGLPGSFQKSVTRAVTLFPVSGMAMGVMFLSSGIVKKYVHITMYISVCVVYYTNI